MNVDGGWWLIVFGIVGMFSGAVTIYVNVGNQATKRNAARQADEARTRAVDAMLPWFAYDQDHDTLPTLVKQSAQAAALAAETSEAAQELAQTALDLLTAHLHEEGKEIASIGTDIAKIKGAVEDLDGRHDTLASQLADTIGRLEAGNPEVRP